MRRPSACFECLFVSLALSLVLTACGGGSSHPGDAGADRTPDAKAKLDTGAVDTGADRRDTGAGTEAGADRADTGGVDTHGDMTTSSADASDARDTVVTRAAAKRSDEGKQHVQERARCTRPDARARPSMEQFADRSKAFVNAAVVR